MKLYRKMIRPMYGYQDRDCELHKEPLEKEETWYPEEERERLREKYCYWGNGVSSILLFDVKYEEYAISLQEEPEMKEFYYKIKNAKINDIELRKAEIYITAGSAYEADDKLYKAGVLCDQSSIERFEKERR